MADFDPADHARATGGLDENNQRTDQSPTARQRLGRFTLYVLILNRTIGRFHSDTASPKTHTLLLGSGIFVTPIKVFNGTGSVGASLLFWDVWGPCCNLRFACLAGAWSVCTFSGLSRLCQALSREEVYHGAGVKRTM